MDEPTDQDYQPLEIKSPLEFDLLDKHGNVVYPAGTVLTPEEIQEILHRGVRGKSLLAPYDEAAVEKLHECFENATVIVEETVDRIKSRQSANLDALHSLFKTYLEEIDRDIATVLYSIVEHEADLPFDTLLAKRSVRLSVLATMIARSSKASDATCSNVATAGLFHDLSLYETVAEDFRKRKFRRNESLEFARQHPLYSAELLFDLEGIPQEVRVLVTQVHEQIDGSGYPLGLREGKLHPMSCILNLVDAYLTMSDISDLGMGVAAADTIAYLMYHTREGRFDRQSMSAFLSICSAYPVGSQVLLTDQSKATVLRSNGVDPLNPIVRLEDSHTIVDLRSSDRKIKQPYFDTSSKMRRLSSDQYGQVFWQG